MKYEAAAKYKTGSVMPKILIIFFLPDHSVPIGMKSLTLEFF